MLKESKPVVSAVSIFKLALAMIWPRISDCPPAEWTDAFELFLVMQLLYTFLGLHLCCFFHHHCDRFDVTNKKLKTKKEEAGQFANQLTHNSSPKLSERKEREQKAKQAKLMQSIGITCNSFIFTTNSHKYKYIGLGAIINFFSLIKFICDGLSLIGFLLSMLYIVDSGMLWRWQRSCKIADRLADRATSQ